MGRAGRKITIGDKKRTEKMMFYIAPEMLADFRILSFIENKTMVEKVISLMEQEIKSHSAEIEAFKAIQNGATRNG